MKSMFELTFRLMALIVLCLVSWEQFDNIFVLYCSHNLSIVLSRKVDCDVG